MKPLLIVSLIISTAFNGYLYDQLRPENLPQDISTFNEVIEANNKLRHILSDKNSLMNTDLKQCLKNLEILREYRGK